MDGRGGSARGLSEGGDNGAMEDSRVLAPLVLEPLHPSGSQVPSAIPKEALPLTCLQPRFPQEPSLETPRGSTSVRGGGTAGSLSSPLSELGEITVGAQGQGPAINSVPSASNL